MKFLRLLYILVVFVHVLTGSLYNYPFLAFVLIIKRDNYYHFGTRLFLHSGYLLTPY